MVQLDRGYLVLASVDKPPAEGGQAVTLPDRWGLQHPDAPGFAWYRFDWQFDGVPSGAYAIYLTATSIPTQVFVNGEIIGATGSIPGPRPRGWQQSRLFSIPADVVRPGRNSVALRVFEEIGGQGGVAPILAGPEPVLAERAMADILAYTLAPVAISITITMLGLFVLVLWLRRRDATYGLFGLAAVLWGMHTSLTALPRPLFPQPHWGMWWNVLYLTFVSLLCLFCLRFAGIDWKPYRRVVVAWAAVSPVLLYVALAFGTPALLTTASALRFGAILLVIGALFAIARYALRQQNVESMLLLLAGALSTAFAVHDWLAAQDSLNIRPIWLVPYAGLAFLTLVGWILTERFVGALNEYESLNADLERRVEEKSAELAAQLEQTRAARDAAIAADRAKSRFLAAASHDLRQPLHALGLFAAGLDDRARDPDDAALAHRISTSVSSLESLLSSMLDISKLETGAITPDVRAFALDPLLSRLANEFALEALERDLSLAVMPTRRAVRSDPLLLERVLRNLVANALRYTKKGGVVVGCRPRGAGVSIEVWDSGPGIAPEEIDRVFEEFYQIGNPERDRARGLGLGLAIVRRLATLLGHDLRVDSRPGRGTVFRIVVASAPEDAVTALPEHQFAEPIGPLSGRRILVVDDEEPVREGTRQLLASWGCIACVAADAASAVSGCTEQPVPDAMLVDFRLPGGRDGLATIAAVRAACGASVPAIIVSGESTGDEIARINASGFMLLHKPVPPARLRAALAHLLAAP